MRLKKLFLLCAVLIGCILPVLAEAPDGWQTDSPYTRTFDPHKIVTISGKVASIDRECVPVPGMAPGVSVVIATDKGDVTVQVGPSWFTEYYRRKWNIQPGDPVTITGSSVTVQGKPVIMATRGQKGDLAMVVRSRRGVPVWDIPVEDF